MTVIAFTGHRPKDLPPGFTRDAAWLRITLALRSLGLDRDLSQITFVTGGALGIDTWAADYALDRGLGLRLVLPFPILTMARFWSLWNAERLEHHALQADTLTIIDPSGRYSPATYQKRNEAMVDQADMLFAFWTGKPGGGTANCVNYATRVDTPIRNLLPGGPTFGS
jgi:uncharacterized phage-like protein YoqJ